MDRFKLVYLYIVEKAKAILGLGFKFSLADIFMSSMATITRQGFHFLEYIRLIQLLSAPNEAIRCQIPLFPRKLSPFSSFEMVQLL